MPVFRVDKVGDYAVIAKHHLKNRGLSYKAKGLMTFMLSVPDEWDFSLAGLATLSNDGIDGVRSGIRELEKHGYLTRRRIRDNGGRLGDIEYTIHEIPQIPQCGVPPDSPQPPPNEPNKPISGLSAAEKPTSALPTLEKPILGLPTLENPTLVKPTLANPMLGKPTLENPTQRSNKELNNNELSNKGLNNKKTYHPPAAGVCTVESQQLSLTDTNPSMLASANTKPQQAERLPVKTADGAVHAANLAMTLVEQQLEIQFEQFWQAYPRKASKKAARKVWREINPNEVLFSSIMSALNAANRYWSFNGISTKHIPHPATWLSEERWEDEFSAEQLAVGQSAVQGGSNQTQNDKGVGGNAKFGADYSIGGVDDPYRAITQG